MLRSQSVPHPGSGPYCVGPYRGPYFPAFSTDSVGTVAPRSAAALTEPRRAVARIGDSQPNDAIAMTVDGVELGVGRDGDLYFAAQRRCVHRGGDLADCIVSRGDLICPQHA